jgi:exodeoxyribonuclease V gamma subunit
MHCDYRLEFLAAIFCDNLTQCKQDPFIEDIVVTQSSTMELYLNKCLADTKQVAINIEYLHPQRSINKIFKLGEIEQATGRLSKDCLIWQIYSLLPSLEDKYSSIKSYIHHDESSLAIRRYQLAKVISGVFDNYMGYRGDWLELWQAGDSVTQMFENTKSLTLGEHEIWQADLWRQLTVNAAEPVEFQRPSRLLYENIASLKQHLPEKITVFGISNLPADFIDFFAILSKYITVDFYYLAPCLDYWGDITRRSAMLEKFANPLLASWALLGRDFFKLLLDKVPEALGGELYDATRQPDNILTALQNDILYNNPIVDSNLALLAPCNFKADNSITINSCYSRMREVEVLHDHILQLLQTADMTVSDIVVMAPNIEEYLPYIQAVFSKLDATTGVDKKMLKELGKDNTDYIAFSIVDCSTLQTSAEAEILMKILNLADSKILAQDMFDIISSDPVCRKFNFSPDDLLSMHELILGANIAWGKDGEQRAMQSDQAGDNLNTWEFGFKRLLAGYAFDTDGLVDDGTLPLTLDSNQGLLLGKLIDICELIFTHLELIKQQHLPQKWHEVLLAIVNDFFHLPQFKNENLQPVYASINLLLNYWSNAKFTELLPLDVVKAALENELNQDKGSGSGFFRGSLTFCRLLPMRNIPFKAICLIGMNEGEFPRQDRSCGFDLAAKEYRSGDRSLRKDDRYIFLETVMACREQLYLSYIGQSNANNEVIPPSILISELLDYLATTTGNAVDDFITQHPLHGFNPEYFIDDSELFSYSAVNCKSARALLNEFDLDHHFCHTALALPEDELEFSFDEFIRFFISPSKFFLNYRLKINLYSANVEPLRSCEPFELDNLEHYKLKDEWLDAKLLHKALDMKAIKKASGSIPAGIWGELILDDAASVTELLAEQIDSLGKKQPISKIHKLEFEVNGRIIKLSGQFDNLYDNGLGLFRPSSIKVQDKLKAWLWHQLALHSALATETTLIGYNKGNKNYPAKLETMKILSTVNHLPELVDIFIQGLCRPLPLFLESSSTFIEKMGGKKPLEVAESLKVASAKWDRGHDDYGYDLADDANRICFGDNPPPLDEKYCAEFQLLAEQLYGRISEEVVKLKL